MVFPRLHSRHLGRWGGCVSADVVWLTLANNGCNKGSARTWTVEAVNQSASEALAASMLVAVCILASSKWCRLLSGGSVRPLGHRNIKLCNWLRRVLMNVYRRSREIRAPIHMVFLGKPKHQVELGVPEFSSEVLLFRHHVAHRTRPWNRQSLLVERSLGFVEHLRLGRPGQSQRCLMKSKWQVRSCGWRIDAERQTHPWDPKTPGRRKAASMTVLQCTRTRSVLGPLSRNHVDRGS
jgi:hypothetical protein